MHIREIIDEIHVAATERGMRREDLRALEITLRVDKRTVHLGIGSRLFYSGYPPSVSKATAVVDMWDRADTSGTRERAIRMIRGWSR